MIIFSRVCTNKGELDQQGVATDVEMYWIYLVSVQCNEAIEGESSGNWSLIMAEVDQMSCSPIIIPHKTIIREEVNQRES